MSGSETSSKTIQPRKLTLPGLKIEAILDVRQQEWMQKALEKAEAEQNSQLLWATRRKTLSEAHATLRTTSEATIEAAASVHGGYT